MDFTPTDGQTDAAQLAKQILTDRCTVERQAEVEKQGGRFDRELWKELGEAGLLGLAVPEEHGGAGLGILELVSVLEEAGRVVAPLPIAPHVVAALTIARYGSEGQRSVLSEAATGANILTAAVAEPHATLPTHPATTAARNGKSWRLTGTKTSVVGATEADLVLVPATTDQGPRVFLMDPQASGATLEQQRITGGEHAGRLQLDGVEADVLDDPDAHQFLAHHLSVAWAAEQLGVCEGALALTSEYARTREQFKRPIGSFQAVSQRLADGYIDVRGLDLTVTSAAWRLSEGLPADVEVATAKLWAADTGHKLAHTTVHVHGGVGIDLDGAAHRYFTTAKRLEFLLGGTTAQARDVGRILAANPA
jgi:alkylation response protein AidB-like acyl-CoA dehydrogenase